ncbi:MAG: hypothetical protein ABID61_04565 [Candidatus Micrarchaeota archaeon]
MLDKKGFLFTVTVFLVLTYILLSISVWVKSVETSEKSFSEFYKQSTVELAIEQITPEKMSTISHIIANRALNRLNTHTIENPAVEGPALDEEQNIRNSMYELILYGNASDSYFYGVGTSITQEENSSFTSWVSNLNASLNAIGVYVSEFDVTNFQFTQGDIDLVNYSFDIHLTLSDLTNTSSISRVYTIKNQLDITGLVDPALVRVSKTYAGDTKALYRMFFFNKALYSTSSTLSAQKISTSVQGGQGWLYGYLAVANASAAEPGLPSAVSVAPTSMHNYILVGTYDEITALPHEVYENFGGYIVTNAPGHIVPACGGNQNETDTFNTVQYSGGSCTPAIGGNGISTSKPFIVSSGFDPTTAGECPVLDGSNITGLCTLFVNNYKEEQVAANPGNKLITSQAGIYSVERMRDFVMCGYYTYNSKSPSYLQRLLLDPYSRNSSLYGIETFIIGIYANDSAIYDTHSRLDRELFDGSITGIKVRGLPGCKNRAACADDPFTGIFAVSDDTKVDYGLVNITCDIAAGCNS